MSVRAIGWAMEQQLPPLQKLVLICLADRQHPDHNGCWPSIARLQLDTGMSRASLFRVLGELEKGGLVRRQQRAGTSTVYHLVGLHRRGLTERHPPSQPETPPVSHRDPEPVTEPLGRESRGARMKRPTVEEIREYCQERGNHIDPEEFWAFYESKGWKVGKSPMKSWKACIVTWEKSHAKSRSSKGTGRRHETKAERGDRILRELDERARAGGY